MWKIQLRATVSIETIDIVFLWNASDVLLNIKNRIQNIINRIWNSATRAEAEPACSINLKSAAIAVVKLDELNELALKFK